MFGFQAATPAYNSRQCSPAWPKLADRNVCPTLRNREGKELVDAIPVLGRNDDNRVVQRVLGQYDAPAFIRRARRVQEALDLVLGRCRQQRDQWLMMPRLRLGMLRALAGDWHRLR